MRRQDISRAVERFGPICFTVLKSDYRDAGVFLFDGVLKTLLAFIGRNRSGFDAEYRDLAFASKLLGEPFGGYDAALSIVGRNIRKITLSADARIENRHRDPFLLRAFDDWNKGVAVRRRQNYPIHTAIDRVLDDVDLAAVIGLLGGAFPHHLDAKFLSGGLSARVNALPEEMRDAFGNDRDHPFAAVTIAGSMGNFELNVFKPVIIYNLLQSIRLLSDVSKNFHDKCLKGIKPNTKQIQKHLENSLMLATALNPVIGYDKASKIVQKAYKEGLSLKQAALKLGYLTSKEFDRIVDPKKMI